MTIVICEDVLPKDLRRLAAVTVIQALQDLKEAPLPRKLDALFWLTGPDFGWWADCANLPFADPFSMLGTGIVSRLSRGKLQE